MKENHHSDNRAASYFHVGMFPNHLAKLADSRLSQRRLWRVNLIGGRESTTSARVGKERNRGQSLFSRNGFQRQSARHVGEKCGTWQSRETQRGAGQTDNAYHNLSFPLSHACDNSRFAEAAFGQHALKMRPSLHFWGKKKMACLRKSRICKAGVLGFDDSQQRIIVPLLLFPDSQQRIAGKLMRFDDSQQRIVVPLLLFSDS